MNLTCIIPSDRFYLTAGEVYQALSGIEPDNDGSGDQWVSIKNDNRKIVRVNFNRFEVELNEETVREKLATGKATDDLAKEIVNAIEWLRNYRSGTDDECEAYECAQNLKRALGFKVEE